MIVEAWRHESAMVGIHRLSGKRSSSFWVSKVLLRLTSWRLCMRKANIYKVASVADV